MIAAGTANRPIKGPGVTSIRSVDPATLSLLSNRLLSLYLMPTEQCNFRCVYCFEDFEQGEMSAEVVASVKALIERRAACLDLLTIEWFGGEPLLAWPIVQELQGFAFEVASRRSDLRFSSSMTTNASLLGRRKFHRLLDLGCSRFQITLDGLQAEHDRVRKRRGGGGSFTTTWSNLLNMRDSGREFTTDLRLHLRPDNLESQRQLLPELARAFAGDPRFQVLYRSIRRFGGVSDNSLAVLDRNTEPAILAELNGGAEALGLRTNPDPLKQPGALPGCYAAASGSYVVRANGDLAKCTVSLRHPNNHVGKLLPDGRVELDDAKMLGWIRGNLTGDRASQECPAKGFAPPTPVLVTLGSGSRSSCQEKTPV